MAKELSELTSQNIIDSRDIIERLEELKDERESLESDVEQAREDLNGSIGNADALSDAEKALADWDEDYKEELDELERINDECSGYGDWEHGEALIDENHFADYVQELAEDIGAIGKNSDWIVIDWEATANNVKADYTEVEIDGTTWYLRA